MVSYINGEKPLVSVIIPTYNRANLIGRAIQSAIDQTYQNIEIIIVNDASNDNTEEIVTKFRNKDVVYIRHENNKGGGAARNTGIIASRGQYIAFLDDDDEWLNDKLEKQVNAIKTLSPEWGGIYCGFYRISDKKTEKVEVFKQGDLKTELLREKFDIGSSSTLLFIKKIILEIGLFDETFERNQDYELLIRFFRKYKLFSLKEPLVKIYTRNYNIPNGEMMAKVKYRYLSKYNNDIYEYGLDIGNEIVAIQWLGVAFIFAKERKIVQNIYYIRKSIKYKILPIKEYLYNLILIIKYSIY
ncbi:MAG: glycosyltransferase family 2 protein [Candidatus Methanoperedens sp.]|nr:glycosyltransferase family 2 protein [Candidatus Methanoperedens sp.]